MRYCKNQSKKKAHFSCGKPTLKQTQQKSKINPTLHAIIQCFKGGMTVCHKAKKMGHQTHLVAYMKIIPSDDSQQSQLLRMTPPLFEGVVATEFTQLNTQGGL